MTFWSLSSCVTLFKDQKEAVWIFWQDPILRIPMLTIWVASFGGSLHDPITTFFYLELGATAAQIGTIGSISTVGALILSPIYGYIQDKTSSFPSMCISCLLCATGCLIRGMAENVHTLYLGALVLGLGVNLWTLVLSHVATSVTPSQRSLVVSGYIGQEKALRLLGRASYPLLDTFLLSLLQVENVLIRYRIIMSVCTIFCFLGFATFVYNRRVFYDTPENTFPMRDKSKFLARKSSDIARVDDSPCSSNMQSSSSLDVDHDDTNGRKMEEANDFPNGQPSLNSREIQQPKKSQEEYKSNRYTDYPDEQKKYLLVFLLLSLTLVLQSAASYGGNILWPLFIRDQFQWGPHEYAWLTLLRSIFVIVSISSLPSLERVTKTSCVSRYGISRLALLIAAGGCWLGFVSVFYSLHQEGGDTIAMTTTTTARMFEDASTTGASIAVETRESSNVSADTSHSMSEVVLFILLLHIGCTVVFFSALAIIEPSLKSLATSLIPRSMQGRTWSILACLQAIGAIIGSSCGTFIYHTYDAKVVFIVITFVLILASFLMWVADCVISSTHREMSFGVISSRDKQGDTEQLALPAQNSSLPEMTPGLHHSPSQKLDDKIMTWNREANISGRSSSSAVNGTVSKVMLRHVRERNEI